MKLFFPPFCELDLIFMALKIHLFQTQDLRKSEIDSILFHSLTSAKLVFPIIVYIVYSLSAEPPSILIVSKICAVNGAQGKPSCGIKVGKQV